MPRLLVIIFFSIIFFGLAAFSLYAQAPQSEEQLKAEDLPEVIRARIIDTTQIALEPRSRFNDSSEPQLIEALGLYAKERRWNLPPILTPDKAIKPEPPQLKNYLLHLTAYPSLPDSLFYRVIFAGDLNETRGFLRLNRMQLGNERTKGRGNYNVDGFRGGLSYQYREQSEIALGAKLDLKDLWWLPVTGGQSNFEKELLLFRSNLNWRQQISETARSTLNLDTEQFRLAHTEDSAGGTQLNPSDRGTDLRFNFDMLAPLPFQNPFHIGKNVDMNPVHIGADVEYFSATDSRFNRDIWSTIFRLYIRDGFTSFGPFALGMGAEGVSFRERDDAGRDQTRLQLNPYLTATTDFGAHWILQLEGERTTYRSKMSELYFDTDYISLNPFLRPEKRWNGEVSLKYYQAKKLEAKFSGFAKRIDDLVVLDRLHSEMGVNVPELTWTPTNIDAWIYGGQFNLSLHITDRLDAQFQYTHEFHQPDVGEWIAYRPNNLIDLKGVYHLPKDFYIELGGEFRGVRHIDATTDETLDSYFLLKPKVSKTVADYVNVFVSGSFAIGKYALLQGYELSQDHFDFGVELRF